MKTAISIPDPLFEAAERLAERLGISRSELYRRAVTRYLQSHSQQVIRETLDEVYGADGEKSELDPAIEFLRDASLPREEW